MVKQRDVQAAKGATLMGLNGQVFIGSGPEEIIEAYEEDNGRMILLTDWKKLAAGRNLVQILLPNDKELVLLLDGTGKIIADRMIDA